MGTGSNVASFSSSSSLGRASGKITSAPASTDADTGYGNAVNVMYTIQRFIQARAAGVHIEDHGCKWRRLPKEYGDWHVIYVRVNRWAKKGVLEKAFLRLQQLGTIHIITHSCLCEHP